MNEADFHILVTEQQNLISSIWQYWLACTFAFIVAFHAGRNSITKELTGIGCGLYFLVSVAAILRYLRTILFTRELNSRMIDSGFEPITTNFILGLGVSITSITVFVLGTVVSIAFGIHQYRARKGT